MLPIIAIQRPFQTYEVTRKNILNTEVLQVGYDTDSSQENEADHEEQKETAGRSVYDTESSDDDNVSQGGSDESEGENADSEAETSDDSDYPIRFPTRLRRQIRHHISSRTASNRKSSAETRPSRLTLYLQCVDKEDSRSMGDTRVQSNAETVGCCPTKTETANGLTSTTRTGSGETGESRSNDQTGCGGKDYKAKRKISETQDTQCRAMTVAEEMPCKKRTLESCSSSGN